MQRTLLQILETLNNPPPRQIVISDVKRDAKNQIVGASVASKKTIQPKLTGD